MRGELDRIFFSGAKIDKHGNLNNTLIGSMSNMRVKLPGGAGASHIGAFAKHFTVWSVRHEATTTGKGQRIYSLVDKVDFVTTMGHRNSYGTRKELGLKGGRWSQPLHSISMKTAGCGSDHPGWPQNWTAPV
jgi:glutaconate CoA-transferase subunit B